MNSLIFNNIFKQSIEDYHKNDDIDFKSINPFHENSLEYLLYKKCWIDTVQWHLEDIIRLPEIDPSEALKIKRRIDLSNQDRTDLVEQIDEYLYYKFYSNNATSSSRINTETPAWAVDRLSILNLKIYHMNLEIVRQDATVEHIEKCTEKLSILNQQYIDLSVAIDQLLTDILNGVCIAKTYKQMKMYNDPQLNPILRKNNI
jgi:hypothetical protein